MNVPQEYFDKAFLACKEFLNGVWKFLTAEEFIINPINGGLTNFIFLCELPPNYDSLRRENEPKKVIVRFYGIGKLSLNEGSSPVLNHLTENLLCAILAERKLGPKVYGVFNGGRIEEYIPARSLLHQELYDPEISRKIADKMGKIHSLNTLPFSKDSNKIFDKMYKWYTAFRKNLKKLATTVPHNLKPHPKFQWLKDANLEKEIEFCRTKAVESKSPIVFCHFDLQPGNILIHRHHVKVNKQRSAIQDNNQNSSHKSLSQIPNNDAINGIGDNFESSCDHVNNVNLHNHPYNTRSSPVKIDIRVDFIDYEYSAYAYRAFDIANHFCEWAIDYTIKLYPYYTINIANYPTKDQQINFIESYLRSYWAATSHHNSTGKIPLHMMRRIHNHSLNKFSPHRKNSVTHSLSDQLENIDLNNNDTTTLRPNSPIKLNGTLTPKNENFNEHKNNINTNTQKSKPPALTLNNSNHNWNHKTKSTLLLNGFSSNDNSISPLDSLDSSQDDRDWPVFQNGGMENDYANPDLAQETEKLLNETKIFMLISHLFWTFWSLVQAGSSKIKFGFEEYAEARFNEYLRQKELLDHL